MHYTIMIADDSMFARMLIKEAISQIYPDAEYIEAISGQQVLDKYTQGQHANWYLLDVNMGEPNGLETAKKLIEIGVSVHQIALVTGNKSTELQQQADTIHLRYINKALGPTDVDGFVARLNTFFNCQAKGV